MSSSKSGIEHRRHDFPLLRQQRRGRTIVYLDNAATTQKPTAVIDSIADLYRCRNANPRRGVHWLSEGATAACEAARDSVRAFLGAALPGEIVFTHGATEAINLVASGMARGMVAPGEEVVVSLMEHHANLVPWQRLCRDCGATLRVAGVEADGTLDLGAFQRLLSPKTRLLAITHVSNVLGTVNPVADLVRMARQHNSTVLIDGAQAAPHLPVDVAALDCDFYVCSGHKIYGPTGVGVLYGKAARLAELPPYQLGGDMVRSVSTTDSVFEDPPARFEAGTPHLAGIVGFAKAIDYVTEIGLPAIAAHEQTLRQHALDCLARIPGLRVFGPVNGNGAGIISFVVDDVHPHDLGTALSEDGIAVRVGHHCAQPLTEALGVTATVRISFALYNTIDEIDILADAIERACRFFR